MAVPSAPAAIAVYNIVFSVSSWPDHRCVSPPPIVHEYLLCQYEYLLREHEYLLCR